MIYGTFTRSIGGSGSSAALIETDADNKLEPTEFLAATLNEYTIPGVKATLVAYD